MGGWMDGWMVLKKKTNPVSVCMHSRMKKLVSLRKLPVWPVKRLPSHFETMYSSRELASDRSLEPPSSRSSIPSACEFSSSAPLMAPFTGGSSPLIRLSKGKYKSFRLTNFWLINFGFVYNFIILVNNSYAFVSF